MSELSRLHDFLASTEGSILYAFRGGKDEAGKPLLQCNIVGSLQLACQRCLAGMVYPVNVDAEWVLVSAASGSDAMDEDWLDARDELVASESLDIVELVEEELLLSLPMAPMHAPDECPAGSVFPGSEGSGAFGVLRALKK